MRKILHRGKRSCHSLFGETARGLHSFTQADQLLILIDEPVRVIRLDRHHDHARGVRTQVDQADLLGVIIFIP